MNKTLTAILLCLTAAITAGAINKATRFDYFGQAQGLNQSAVYSLACDPDGFLWLGTQEGIIRFDGRIFRSYINRGADAMRFLSSRRITNITPDSNHHLWLQSYDGHICLFDQVRESFSVYPKDATDKVRSFLVYNDTIVLVATQNSSLLVFRFDDLLGQYSLKVVQLNDIRALYNDSDGNLWIPTAAGIYLIKKNQIEAWDFTPKLVTDPMVTSGAVCENRRYILFGTWGRGLMAWDKTSLSFSRIYENTLGSDDITILKHAYGKGTIIGTANAQLFALDNNKVQPIHYHGQGRDNITNAYVDHYGMAWVTTQEKGVTRIDIAKSESKFYRLSPSFLEQVIDFERPLFFEDNDNILWVGTTGSGLLRYDRENDKFDSWLSNISDPTSIPSNIVLSMAEDKAGNLWLGTGQYLGGLVRMVSNTLAFHSVKPAPDARTLGENIVRSAVTDKDGNVLAATRGGHFHLFDKNDNKVDDVVGVRLLDGRVLYTTAYGMTITSDGRLWLATKGFGVFFSTDPVDLTKPELDKYRFCHLSDIIGSLTSNELNLAYSITEDDNGNIWIATYGGGLVRIDATRGKFKAQTFNTQNSNIANNRTRFVMTDHLGDLWIGSLGGVDKIKAADLNSPNPTIKRIEDNADVCHIYESENGDILLSTIGRGLKILTIQGSDTTRLNFTTTDGLCDNSVFGVAEDNDGFFWITTENGVNRLNKDYSAVERYNNYNGLGFCSFSEATIARTANGDVIAGGRDGYVRIKPSIIEKKRQDDEIMITALWVNDVSLDAGHSDILPGNIAYVDNVVLKHSQNDLVVTFASMDFTDTNKANYPFRLVGYDDQWQYSDRHGIIKLNSIPTGHYTLEIRHRTFDGRWSHDIKRLGITILPPWWATWWAFLIYLAIGLAIGFGVILLWRKLHTYKRLLLDLEDLICCPDSLLTPQHETFAPAPDEPQEKKDAQRAKDEEFVADLIKFAEDNYRENLSIEQIAEHFNMSRTVFFNKVKTLTGKGPLDVVRQVKFRIAADLLRNGHNVSEAAMEIGYSDVKYFSKLFKSFFGHTPSKEKENA
ncbi:MAG: helix-turn-helix domain-containing protein [Bacteroidales bacterium]|nr:helix-turn-helix domain-containing protein [Bacteroidales bacterium]